MSIFNKHAAPAPPKPLSVTEILRHHLTSRIRHRPLNRIVEDINDEITAKANRETARAIAAKMVGDDASAAAIASVAKTLVNGFGSDVGREAHVAEAALQAFLDGGDLGDVAKARLAEYLYAGHTTYDAERDGLKPARAQQLKTITAIPPRWVHPNENVRRAQADYQRVLEAERRR